MYGKNKKKVGLIKAVSVYFFILWMRRGPVMTFGQNNHSGKAKAKAMAMGSINALASPQSFAWFSDLKFLTLCVKEPTDWTVISKWQNEDINCPSGVIFLWESGLK